MDIYVTDGRECAAVTVDNSFLIEHRYPPCKVTCLLSLDHGGPPALPITSPAALHSKVGFPPSSLPPTSLPPPCGYEKKYSCPAGVDIVLPLSVKRIMEDLNQTEPSISQDSVNRSWDSFCSMLEPLPFETTAAYISSLCE